mmetsp:Transcript_64788/g.200568  ORF Transcript_64788/g.200568 Transcript_64788/m.200568 type:complete len:256 (+) Transcript_64788:363-1130(+)
MGHNRVLAVFGLPPFPLLLQLCAPRDQRVAAVDGDFEEIGLCGDLLPDPWDHDAGLLRVPHGDVGWLGLLRRRLGPLAAGGRHGDQLPHRVADVGQHDHVHHVGLVWRLPSSACLPMPGPRGVKLAGARWGGLHRRRCGLHPAATKPTSGEVRLPRDLAPLRHDGGGPALGDGLFLRLASNVQGVLRELRVPRLPQVGEAMGLTGGGPGGGAGGQGLRTWRRCLPCTNSSLYCGHREAGSPEGLRIEVGYAPPGL